MILFPLHNLSSTTDIKNIQTVIENSWALHAKSIGKPLPESGKGFL